MGTSVLKFVERVRELRFLGIDPATVTGFVALDFEGNVLHAVRVGKAVKGGMTIPQLIELENEIYRLLRLGDEVVKEDAAPGTQKALTTGKVHGGLETMIYRRGLIPNIVAPAAVKKFVGVSNWVGEKGSKMLLKDKEKKAAMAVAVREHYGFMHKSHDIVDAYVMAQIARALYNMREGLPLDGMRPYQLEVVRGILEKREAAEA
jgi:crossover junction endodeoxyribonuclease RuvC